MKFIPLTTMIMSAAVLAGIATAKRSHTPDGGPCTHPGQYECGSITDYNGGNAFLFQCSKFGIISDIQNCNCPVCCSVYKGGVAPDGYTKCT
ncbi:hypothetical protein BDR03DRAFT_872523 [Suillus americanus]|nr:hypothetical protein BDR03DRAFT_872523 [Suillus americanus]